MNITERCNKVLSEIDAALALAEKATPGGWKDDGAYVLDRNRIQIAHCSYAGRYALPQNDNAAFIATSRTLLPTSLRCLKTAIEGLLHTAAYGDPNSCHRAFAALTTLCDQWEAGQ